MNTESDEFSSENLRELNQMKMTKPSAVAFSLEQQVDLKNWRSTRAEELSEGTYEGFVEKAGIKNIETKNGPATIFEIGLNITGGIYSITYWLTSEPNLRRCLTNLKRIGFECDQWGPAHGRPYTTELEGAAQGMVGSVLSFKRGTSQTGYATITLESLDEADDTPSAGSTTASEADLPF